MQVSISLFVGFTSGTVRVFDFDLKLLTQFKAHDFGVNCMALTQHFVVTGGDD
jgi:hypothetical protein